MRRSHLGLASLVCLGLSFALLVACGGTSDVTIPGAGTDASSTNDGSVSPGDGAVGTDATTTSDASDPSKDAGLVVTEEPSPDCHDLKQIGPLVTPTIANGDPPEPLPIASIPPGRYVAKEITLYGMATVFSAQRITADFTGTREYYIAAMGAQSTVYTLDYKVTNGVISRDIVCPNSSPKVPDARIGAAPNGFVIFVTQSNSGSAGSVETVRYERAS